MGSLAIIIIGLFFINGSSQETSENRTETPLEAKLALENKILIGVVVILLLIVIVLLCFLCQGLSKTRRNYSRYLLVFPCALGKGYKYKKEDPEKRNLIFAEEVPVPTDDSKPSQETPLKAKFTFENILICTDLLLLIGIMIFCFFSLETSVQKTENLVEAKLASTNKILMSVAVVLVIVIILLGFLSLKKKKKELEKSQLQAELIQLQAELSQLQAELSQLQAELRWRGTHRYAEDIYLNPDTAHPNLSIARNKKHLTHEVQPQKALPNPERFDATVCVLGSEGFSSGKHYWEVDVQSSTDWDLGVASKSIKRKGKLSLSPKEGFWVLGFSGRDYWAKTDPWTRVMVQRKPKKIGVYLSCKESQVTFFSVTDMSVLFTFSDCSFTGEVCPFFKNSQKETTMIICSLREGE